MSNPLTLRTIVGLMMVLVLAPSAYLAMPQRAYAIPVAVVSDTSPTSLADLAKNALTSVQSVLTQANTWVSRIAAISQEINTNYLQPLAFVLSGQLMKALTASVMKFVIGKANGTGVPQFTVDVQKSLRSISDFQKNAYLRQVSLTNSPFASSIAQALNINYNQNTSLAGFWAANQNTLGRNIPTYRPGFLSGNWSQGGTAAWFQLTTQTQNNPYILYQSTQAQLANVIGPGVGGSSGARLAQLSWGQGFMSWCSSNDTATQTQNEATTMYQECMANGGTGATCQSVYDTAGGIAAGGGVNPGDPCTNKDGTAGTIATPGSTIKATLDKVLGGQQDKLVQMGNISSQVNTLLGNIGTILNTVNLAANILGAGDTGSGGLLTAGQPKGTLSTYGAPTSASGLTNGYGVSGSQLATSGVSTALSNAQQGAAQISGNPAANTSVGSGTGILGQINAYQAAWSSIGLSANETLTALKTMRDVCTAFPNTIQANAAQNAISTEVSPVLTQVAQAQSVASTTLAQYNLVQAEDPSSHTYAADVQKLNSMPPTVTDVANAQNDATAYGGATANPSGSLTVSGSSIVDQMNLIRNNAVSIQLSSCTANTNVGGG